MTEDTLGPLPSCTNCTAECVQPIWVQREQRNVLHEIEGHEYEWKMRVITAGVFCDWACASHWAEVQAR